MMSPTRRVACGTKKSRIGANSQKFAPSFLWTASDAEAPDTLTAQGTENGNLSRMVQSMANDYDRTIINGPPSIMRTSAAAELTHTRLPQPPSPRGASKTPLGPSSCSQATTLKRADSVR